VNYARKRNAGKRDSDAAPLLVYTAARFGAMQSVDMWTSIVPCIASGQLDQQQEKLSKLPLSRGGLSIEENREGAGRWR